MRSLAQIIKELRQKKGTQIAVAARLKVVTSQQLGSYESGKYRPKAEFYEAWKNEFGEDILAIWKGNDERNLSNETKNHTQVDKPSDNAKNGHAAKETFYRDFIENNPDYSIIPKAVFRDYKIVPDKIVDAIIQSATNEKKSLEEKYEIIIDGYKLRVERLQNENDELRRQIPGKPKTE